MVHNNERYSFLKPAVHVQFKTDNGNTHTLFYSLNTILRVERRLPTYMYTIFYKKTKLNYKMYALEFLCERFSPLY